MSSRIKRILIYAIIACLFSLLVLFLPINNIHISTVIYLVISFYLFINYFANIEYPYLRQLYVGFMLITSVYNFICFSLVSVILSAIISFIFFLQYFLIRHRSKEVEEILIEPTLDDDLPKEEYGVSEIKNIAEKLYLKMQEYFTTFDYDNLRDILGKELFQQFEKQMHSLEKTNRQAVRDNIIFTDFRLISTDDNIIVVDIGVQEDKYTISENIHPNAVRYDSHYEVYITNNDSYRIERLNLIYSRSIKKG